MSPRVMRYHTWQDVDGVWTVSGVDYEIAVWGDGRAQQERRFRDFVRESFPAEEIRFSRFRAGPDPRARQRAERRELAVFAARNVTLMVYDAGALGVEN